jgi:hypothetical protein
MVGSRAVGEMAGASRRLPDRVGCERLVSGRNDIDASFPGHEESIKNVGRWRLLHLSDAS